MTAACSMLPTNTLPRPHRPAATAACSTSGAPAMVMRAAIELGVMPCSGYGDRIEELRLRRCRLAPRELEESHVAQVEMADNFVRQIEATHCDSIGCAPNDVAADRLMFTGHGSSFHRLNAQSLRGIG